MPAPARLLLTSGSPRHPARARLALGALLLFFAPAAGADILVNNGLAPPNPANVLTVTATPENYRVQNVGCDTSVADPCVAPGAPTEVEIRNLTGVEPYTAEVHETSVLRAIANLGTVSAEDQAHLHVLGYGIQPQVRDHATLYFESGGVYSGAVTLVDDTHFVGLGGFVDTLVLQDNSSAQIGGTTFEFVRISTTGVVQIDDIGVVGDFQTFLSSNVSILDGRLGNSDGGGVFAYDDSTVSIFGGRIDETGLRAYDSARILMRGGVLSSVTNAPTEAHDSATITFFGSDFTIDGSPVGAGPISATSGVLAGMLESGDRITDQDFARFGSGQIVLTIVPEPGTALLVGFGLVGLAARRRRPIR